MAFQWWDDSDPLICLLVCVIWISYLREITWESSQDWFSWSQYASKLYSMRGSRDGGKVYGPPTPLKNYKIIGFLSNAGPDPLKTHKATKPAFEWRFAGGLMMARFYWYLNPLSPHQGKKKKVLKKVKKVGHPLPPDIIFWIRECIVT